jgi:hypothetical protein
LKGRIRECPDDGRDAIAREEPIAVNRNVTNKERGVKNQKLFPTLFLRYS